MREKILEKINTSPSSQVNLNGLEIKDDEIAAIMKEIKRLRPNMTSIFFAKNMLSDDGAVELSEKLTEFTNLTFIDVQANQIGEKGAAALCQLKTNNPSLIIALHGNLITNTGRMEEISRSSAPRPGGQWR